MIRAGKALTFVLVAALIAGCGGSGTVTAPIAPMPSTAPTIGTTASPSESTTPTAKPTATPTVKPSGSPTATPTASPVPTPTPTIGPGGLTAPQVNAALASTQSYYASLPHTDVVSDLKAVAKQMVSSGTYKTAVLTPGGITGTLRDGSTALVFADEPEELNPAASAAARRISARKPSTQPKRFAGSAPNPHNYVFLYNQTDPDFTPNFDKLWSAAIQNVPFTGPSPAAANPSYHTMAGNITLDNIAAFSDGAHPIDFLNMTTHGMVATTSLASGSTSAFYLLSTTEINPATRAQYMTDYLAKNIVYGVFLSVDSSGTPANNAGQFAFTPSFLTSHVKFNPGAVVNLAACFGQSPTIAASLGATLKAAGVGRYYGWTKAVGIVDDYQSMSFLFDRLVGEQSPTVNDLVGEAAQRTPPQRPFPLDDIYGVMQTEMRSNAIEPAKPYAYAYSDVMFPPNASQPPTQDGTAARYVVSDLGGGNVAGAPIVYGFPSISSLSIAETSSSGTMTIAGHFPADQGTVIVNDTSGVTQLTVTNWSTSSVTALLPAGGNGSSGLVTVLSVLGVPSNPVPLTKWSGILTYTENDSIPDLGGTSGSGSGTLSAQFNIDFRSDVHPVVPTIDTSPLPQPFVFDFTEGDSTAQLTNYSGSYTSTSEKTAHTATFSLASPAPILRTATPPLHDNTFEVRSFAGQPMPCNSGDKTTANSISTSGDVFCPLVGFLADPSQVLCTDDDSGALCSDNGLTGIFAYSGPFDAMGLLSFTLDPASYKITVAGTTSNFTSQQFYDSDRPATASMSGAIDAPLYPPLTTTPAFRTPRKVPTVVHRTSLGPVSPDEAQYASTRRPHIKGLRPHMRTTH